ncbi:uncharacterized protein LOC122577543 [Bombus pyrosoma]|uniref:uncharacterized protein LOC122577543 n=1 Tax=Bombus pyrosoma TaxID=396416 RepID=UPI001CB8F47A|nr:uncharacterized protein LOC122577543 [Bombus pyrosoma]
MDASRKNVPGFPRLPRCATVSLTAKDGSGFRYREAMSVFSREIKLFDLDIAEVRPRKAITGTVILEIAGRGRGREKALLMAERMADVFGNTLVRVAVPQRMAELRITKHSTGRCSFSPQRPSRRSGTDPSVFRTDQVAETARNLKGTQVKTLKEVATSIVLGVTEIAKRADPASGALAIMEGRIAALEAENDARRKELASRSTIEKSSETARLDAIERKIEELGPSLVQRMEERIQSIEKRMGKEAAPEETTKRDLEEPEAPATTTSEEGQPTAAEWQTVAGRKKKKKEAAGMQPAKITPRIRAKIPGKALEEGSENDRSSQSYAEVLAAANDSVSLAEVGISAVRMRKAITGGVVLEVPKDQKREKAAALAARLTQTLDPSKVRVATPFRTAEARVTWADISATTGDVRNTSETPGEGERLQGGGHPTGRDPLRSKRPWIRMGTRPGRGSEDTGTGWYLETGHISRMCTSKEDREYLCYRCGDPGYQARACTAANPKCLLYEALGAPSTNLGRSRRAQVLLYQTVRESAVALAVVAEPYRVLDAPDWTGDADEMVAVTWTSTPGALTHGVPLERGDGYVAVEWAGMVVVGVYLSPNSGWAAFEKFLDGVGDCIRRHLPRQILVLGDFNAHSAEWGHPRVRLGRGTWATAGEQELDQHLRDMEGEGRR